MVRHHCFAAISALFLFPCSVCALDFADALDAQRLYFQQIQSAVFRTHCTTAVMESSGATDPSRSRQEHVLFALAGDRYYACREGFDSTLGRVVSQESAFDGQTYMNTMPEMLLIGVGRDYRVQGADPALAPNILIYPFYWSVRQDREFTYRELRRPEHWSQCRFSPVSSRRVSHRGHDCLEFTFTSDGMIGITRRISVAFALDLGLYPIRTQYWTDSETDGDLTVYSEIEVLGHTAIVSEGNQIIFPTAVERRSYGDAGELRLRITHEMTDPETLTVNEQIPSDRFTVDLERPGYVLYDNDRQDFVETATTTLADRRELLGRQRAAAEEGVVRTFDESGESAQSARAKVLLAVLGLVSTGLAGLLIFAMRR